LHKILKELYVERESGSGGKKEWNDLFYE
jgi:hypothetical protein